MVRNSDIIRFWIREQEIEHSAVKRDDVPSISSPSLLAKTMTMGHYPATARCYFVCQPLLLLGTEVEGGAGVFSETDSTFFALNLGNATPPIGTQVLVTFVGNRWVFRYDG